MCTDGNNGMRSGKWWLPALAVTLVLSCIAAPLRAEIPSCLSFLPGAGSLPENTVIRDEDDAENTFYGDQGSALANAQRVYWYLHGGDELASLVSQKYIIGRAWLQLYNSEGAPELATLRKHANADGPPEIRRRFPQVYRYTDLPGLGYSVNAIQGRFALTVTISYWEQDRHNAEVLQKADSLGIWLLAEILKKLPAGSPDANP